MNKTYKIFQLNVARELTHKGFHLEKVVPNKEKPWLNVYCFTDSEELREALPKAIAKYNRKKQRKESLEK